MREYLKFYIDGQWVDPVEPKTLDVNNPATEQVVRQDLAGLRGRRRQGGQGRPQGVRDLVADQPRRAPGAAAGDPRRIPEALRRPGRRGHRGDGRAGLAGQRRPGRRSGMGHLATAIEVLKNFHVRGTARRDAGRQGADRRLRPDHAVELADQPDRLQGGPGAGDRLHHGAEAVGSRAVLRPDLRRDHATPPAFRPGCSTWSTATARRVGAALSSHPDVDMVSFTGSTRAGVDVAKQRRADGQARGPGAGRQEPEHRPRRRATSPRTSPRGVAAMMLNSGQSCNAPTRMLVPNARMDEAIAVAREAAEQRDRRRSRTATAPSARWSRRRSSTRSRA